MSRTQITLDTYPDAYLALLPLLQAVPDLCIPGSDTPRVPDGQGWIVQSPLHPPYFEYEVFVLDENHELIIDDKHNIVLDDHLHRLHLPADFPLPAVA